MEGLNELLKLLADKLGVGLDFVQANAPQYLEEYGRYLITKNVFNLLMIGFFISLIVMVICIGITTYMIDECKYEEEPKYKKIRIKSTIICGVIGLVSLPIFEIIIYLSSPQMYVIEELLKCLK